MMQEKKTFKFRFCLEDETKDLTVSANIFSEKMFLVEMILNTFVDSLQTHKITENNKFVFENKFIFANSIEICTYDESGNSVKFNLIDLFFDKTLKPRENITLNNHCEPILYAHIHKEFFDLPKKIREIITLSHLLFNLTLIFIECLENLEEISSKHYTIIKFLLNLFSKCQTKFNDYICKQNFSLYLNNKKNAIGEMKTHMLNKLNHLKYGDSFISKILELEESQPISCNDKGDINDRRKLEKDLQEIYVKFVEALNLNNNAVFQVLKDFYKLIKIN